VRLQKIFAIGGFPRDKIGNGVEPQTIDAHVEPMQLIDNRVAIPSQVVAINHVGFRAAASWYCRRLPDMRIRIGSLSLNKESRNRMNFRWTGE
jgi:hypothetical protein